MRDATFVQYLALANDLLVILYLGLGCWRAAPITRLLLRSAENHLDLQTNKTMGRFFENIFHALVMLFVGIAVLDRMGVPVSGLLTGAGVAGLAVSLAAQTTLNNLIAGVTLVLAVSYTHLSLRVQQATCFFSCSAVRGPMAIWNFSLSLIHILPRVFFTTPSLL